MARAAEHRRMTTTDPNLSLFRRLIAIDQPWIWLVYLPLYGATWLGNPPSAGQLTLSAVGVVVFLVIYIEASHRKGRSLIASAIAVLLLGFALSSTGGNWMVFTIYAASIGADLRPAREGRILIVGLVLASTAFAAIAGLIWYFIAMVDVFALVAAYSIMAGHALGEKHADLMMAQEEVRRLSREAERERIARDLHDLLGRTLTLVALKADLAVKLTRRDPDAAEREMRDVAEAARSGLADVRAAVLGMTTAGLAREIDASRAALAAAGVDCVVTGDAAQVSIAHGAVLAMALREAVTNVIRHADAKQCTIALTDEHGRVGVTVTDDGQGGHFREGAGIAGMRSRLAAAGGYLAIAADTSGTRIAAAVPAPAA
ncbi:sensor histidine kinase [Sphingomonas koreensis]|nr:sensor histidine kinase [Sphingomonas koreensis]